MAPFFRRITRKFFVLFTLVLFLLFVLGSINYLLHPDVWWVVSLMGPAYPYLLVIMLFLLVFWLLKRSKWALLPLIGLALGYKSIAALVAFNFSAEFNAQKPANSLRVLTWNVHQFDRFNKPEKAQEARTKIFEFIGRHEADVVLLQEIYEPHRITQKVGNIELIQQMGFPYYYFVKDYINPKIYHGIGPVIFSKYPIIDSIRVSFEGENEAAESLIAIDILAGTDTIRFVSTHLQSFQLHRKDYQDLEAIKKVDDNALEASKSIIKKLSIAYKHRGDQADLVRRFLDESPYPVIISGDFNDVPNSYAYFRIRGDYKDAFIKKGAGLDRTYPHILPTLRIDYILAHPDLEILQYKCSPIPYSDHYPLVADFALPIKKQQN